MRVPAFVGAFTTLTRYRPCWIAIRQFKLAIDGDDAGVTADLEVLAVGVADGERRLEGLAAAVLSALAERDRLVRDAERRPAERGR